MKVDPSIHLANIKKMGQKSQVSPQDAPSTGKKEAGVEISSLAMELARMEETTRNLPDVRSEKVNQLKGQIERGEYKIDEDKLAEIMSRFI